MKVIFVQLPDERNTFVLKTRDGSRYINRVGYPTYESAAAEKFFGERNKALNEARQFAAKHGLEIVS